MTDINKLVRPNIAALQPYSSARDEFSGKANIFMDANENPFGTANRYPDPLQKQLKQKLSTIKQVPSENIFLGNGSDEIIDLCFRIFCEPGKDKAIIFTPTYGMYEVSAAINNIELIKIPLDENFQIDQTQLAKQLNDSSVKIVFICSPNNPTGNTINAIEYVCENFKGIVLLDEAYIDFSQTQSLSNKINNYSNLIVIQTLSKAFGMASLRIGMAFTNKEIIAVLNKVKPPYNISEANYSKALENLFATDYAYQISVILTERERVSKALTILPFVTKVYPSQANFILIETINANTVYIKLIENGIVIRNRNKIINNCVRITIGSILENNALLNVLQNITL